MRMIDVSEKPKTARVAVARGAVRLQPQTLKRIEKGQIEKGDVLATARLAGILAAKRTPDLIPLCHPIALTGVEVRLTLDRKASRVEIEATVKTKDRTGVEMEALAAVSAAALTVYDMCKSIDRGMVIDEVGLQLKSGGRSGTWRRK